MILTKNILKKFKNGEVFCQGMLPDSEEGLHMANTGRLLVWVAVKGSVEDWTIYCHFIESGYNFARTNGDKVYDKRNILKCIQADEETLNSYRY